MFLQIVLIVCLDDINMATIFLKPVPPPPTAFLVMLYLGKGLTVFIQERFGSPRLTWDWGVGAQMVYGDEWSQTTCFHEFVF